MSAWIWTGNPDRWKAQHGTDGYKAMWSYLHHESNYVYWATTAFYDEVKVDDVAYIWRAQSSFSDKNGIVAVGVVKEEPLEYTAENKSKFMHPERLDAAGWDEERATSRWKTGILIQSRRWNSPIHIPNLMLRQSINALSDEQRRRIEAALSK
jgi:hypothetical protein